MVLTLLPELGMRARAEGGSYELDISQGLKAGTEYDDFSVVEDMSYKADERVIGGISYPGYVVGTSAPDTSDYSSGAILKITPAETRIFTIAFGVSEATYYFMQDDIELYYAYTDDGASVINGVDVLGRSISLCLDSASEFVYVGGIAGYASNTSASASLCLLNNLFTGTLDSTSYEAADTTVEWNSLCDGAAVYGDAIGGIAGAVYEDDVVNNV